MDQPCRDRWMLNFTIFLAFRQLWRLAIRYQCSAFLQSPNKISNIYPKVLLVESFAPNGKNVEQPPPAVPAPVGYRLNFS
jgi:hypothetical protein